jgi:hypothetical protein
MKSNKELMVEFSKSIVELRNRLKNLPVKIVAESDKEIKITWLVGIKLRLKRREFEGKYHYNINSYVELSVPFYIVNRISTNTCYIKTKFYDAFLDWISLFSLSQKKKLIRRMYNFNRKQTVKCTETFLKYLCIDFNLIEQTKYPEFIKLVEDEKKLPIKERRIKRIKKIKKVF